MENNVWILGVELTSSYVSEFSELGEYFHSISDRQNNLQDVKSDGVWSYLKPQNIATIVSNYLGARYAKKIDRSVQFGLYAGEHLLKKINLSAKQRSTTGIMLGNNYAGWSYVEDQMYNLYQGDHRAINPYVATAWFPAALQGELSIRNGLHSVSKTFSQDRLSSAVAINFAIDMLNTRKLDYVLAGGYEALTSPFMQEVLLDSGITNDEYLSQDIAAMLMLSRAKETHLRPIAKIAAIEWGKNLVTLVAKFKKAISVVDMVILGSMKLTKNNLALIDYEKSVLHKYYDGTLCEMPTYFMGESGGAAFALDIVIALWLLKQNGLQRILIVGRDYVASQYYICVVEAVAKNK